MAFGKRVVSWGDMRLLRRQKPTEIGTKRLQKAFQGKDSIWQDVRDDAERGECRCRAMTKLPGSGIS